MQIVSDETFAKIQKLERDWWTHTDFNPTIEWSYYVRTFTPYLKAVYDVVCDVGSGPVPFVCLPTIHATAKVVIDPLWDEYRKIERYKKWTCQINAWYSNIERVVSHQYDAVFALNMLDHCQRPDEMVVHLQRILRPYGHLYLFVDLDKSVDQMHPYSISLDWLTMALSSLTTVMLKTEKSWKFKNDVCYYVGKKLEVTGEI